MVLPESGSVVGHNKAFLVLFMFLCTCLRNFIICFLVSLTIKHIFHNEIVNLCFSHICFHEKHNFGKAVHINKGDIFRITCTRNSMLSLQYYKYVGFYNHYLTKLLKRGGKVADITLY